ncbi:unnamed protein product [Caenorhabditis sp. 36 PRJEB53466]|nr:unnamed protein product [Caenorhabditis sp. 36 PRJEB53466]
MNATDVELVRYAQKVDHVFIIVGYIINPLGLLFNSILIYLISMKTPKSLRSFSILLMNFALCDFFSSLAGMLALQRTVFSGWSLTYIFHGMCGRVSSYFCYFLHVFVCHCFAHSQWILMISFLYRYYILDQISPDPVKIVRICVTAYIPSILFLLIYLSDVADAEELKMIVFSYHKQYFYHVKQLWGDISIAGNVSVWSVSTFSAIIYMTIPCFPIYVIIIYFRHKTLKILDGRGRMTMSETTRSSHKQLIKALTIQAVVPIFWLTASSFYLLLLFQFVGGVIIENMIFRIMECMPMCTPLISLYFVRPYRSVITAWITPTSLIKPVIVTSLTAIVIPTVIIYATVFLLGLFGNTCTCIVIVANKSMHNPTNYYLFSLAISDIIALILGLPMELYQSLDYSYPYRFSEQICKARAFLIEFTSYASIMIICCFSFERWLAICYPLQTKIFSTLWRANVLIVLAWSISFLCALPIAFIVKINYLPLPHFALNQSWTNLVSSDGFSVMRTEFCAMNQARPDQQKNIIIFAFTAFFIVPAIAIVIMYAHIAIKLNSSENTKELKEDPLIKQRRSKSNRTVLKMLLSVVITFFLCWLPFHIQRLLSVYIMSEPSAISPPVQFLSMIVFYISGFCYYSNSAANPILYNILSEKYRSAFCHTILGDQVARMIFKGKPGKTK